MKNAHGTASSHAKNYREKSRPSRAALRGCRIRHSAFLRNHILQQADTVDFDLLADCFTEDATLTTRRGTRTGRDAVVAYYREALADPIERRHFLANQDVEVTAADAGTVRAMFAYTYSGEGVGILGWGRYVDEVRLDDAGVGRISAKTISIDVHADPRDGWAR